LCVVTGRGSRREDRRKCPGPLPTVRDLFDLAVVVIERDSSELPEVTTRAVVPRALKDVTHAAEVVVASLRLPSRGQRRIISRSIDADPSVGTSALAAAVLADSRSVWTRGACGCIGTSIDNASPFARDGRQHRA
jgi:hypothetical protein